MWEHGTATVAKKWTFLSSIWWFQWKSPPFLAFLAQGVGWEIKVLGITCSRGWGGGQLKTIFNRNMLKFQCVPGNYLWEHIFRGKLEKKLGGIWSYGEKRQQNIVFRYVKTISTESVRPHIIYLLGYVTRRSEKLDLQKKWIQRFIGEQPQYTFTPRKVTTCNWIYTIVHNDAISENYDTYGCILIPIFIFSVADLKMVVQCNPTNKKAWPNAV